MVISGTLNVSSEVDNYTLVELLDLLGSPKKLKDALANLEAVSRKTNKSLKDLTKAQNDFDNGADAENRRRGEEIDAIQKDQEALAKAWDKLDEDTKTNNARKHEANKALKRDREALDTLEAKLKKEGEFLENARAHLGREKENVDGQVAEARRDATADRKAAETAKDDAKRLNTEANRKLADMRKLVA
jgi:chromosome segregation ATPase